MRQLETGPHLQVTLETGFRRSVWVDDFAAFAAGLDMQTSRAVTRFAAHVLGVFSLHLQTSVSRGAKIARDLFVTSGALFGSDELRAGNAGRCEQRAIRFEVTARQQNDGERKSTPDCPPEFFALTVDPSSYPRMPHETDYYQETRKRQRIFTVNVLVGDFRLRLEK